MYDRALTAQPILTKTLTSVVLFTAGDLAAQRLEKGSFEGLDGARLARQGAWGALFTPLAHYWYLNLDRWVPGTGAAIVARKVRAGARALAGACGSAAAAAPTSAWSL
jgi:hypothetical protein